MSDIFGRRDQVLNGGLSADSMFMVWPELKNDGAGLLIQNISLQYTQPVRRIFELGPGDRHGAQYTYYIVGRPEGQFQMARIVGIAAISSDFYETYGDPCNDNPNITITGNGGCNGGVNSGQVTWTMVGVILTGVGMQASAQEMVFQESVSGMFVSFVIES